MTSYVRVLTTCSVRARSKIGRIECLSLRRVEWVTSGSLVVLDEGSHLRHRREWVMLGARPIGGETGRRDSDDESFWTARYRVPIIDSHNFGTIEGEVLDPPVKVADDQIRVWVFEGASGESSECVNPL